MSKLPNPPAFPVSWEEENGLGERVAHIRDGMTLRDWFAGQVVAQTIGLAVNQDGSWEPESVAYHAYFVADAMLAERAKGRAA